MKRIVVGGTLLATGLALAVLGGSSASASPSPPGFPCGRIVAFTAPTATTQGSIQLGTTTYRIAAGAQQEAAPSLAVGQVICLVGRLSADSAFTTLSATTLGDQIVCGQVTGVVPASPATAGTLTMVTNATWTLSIRPGLSLTPAQTTGSQCFKFDIDAQGNVEVVSYWRPVAASPSTGTAVPVQLPSTETAQADRRVPFAPIALAGASVVIVLVAASAVWSWLRATSWR